jgi:aminoglycoside phosphotransferase (APT) family kinase protein
MSRRYRQLFEPVFKRVGFAPTKDFRTGPRFYVIGGDYKGKKAVFKADLEASAKTLPKARLRLRREGIFLKHVRLEHVPEFYTRGVEDEIFWILEEWVPGESQEQGESTFLIKDSFFTKENLQYSLEFFEELHRLSKVRQPQFEKHFNRYTLSDYMFLMRIDRAATLGKKLASEADRFLVKCHRLFGRSQTVITHHELYGPHIFVNSKEFHVIDWENVGWGNPAHDFVQLWIRSFNHPDFREELFRRFLKLQDERDEFLKLFRLELILQGIGNLNYFKLAKLAEEKEIAGRLTRFLKEAIAEAVSGERFA